MVNPRHQRFVEEYSLDHNGAAAAARAGYAESRAKQTASRLLARPDVAALVDRLDAEQRERLGVDGDQWLAWALDLYAAATRGRPRTYRSELVRDELGEVIYDPNVTAAAKVLELIGKRLGLLSERQTMRHEGDVVYTLRINPERSIPIDLDQP